MINPKNISISAGIGFFLSFFIGLISDVRFSHVLLRALICAAVFAALCVGITFLYQKFLSNTDNGGFSADISDSAPQKSAGGVVNIVVDDANLIDDGMTPKFTVLNTHSDLSAAPKQEDAKSPQSAAVSPVESVPNERAVSGQGAALSESEAIPAPAQSASDGAAADNSFKSASLTSVTKAASSEGASENSVQSVAPQPAASTSSASGGAAEAPLDDLPDIASMEGEAGAASLASELESDSSDEIVTDTDFSMGGAHLKEQPISGDTKVMAQAISTLLAKDNS